MGSSKGALVDPSFKILWLAFVLAQGGSALGAVAIPLIAINEFGLSDATIALLATSSALVLLLASLPAGYIAEFRRKRPVMIGADLTRAVSFTLVAILFVTGTVGVLWLASALAANAAMQILFNSASSAHTKDLLDPEYLADGLGKLQAAAWMSMIAGPVAAGAVVAVTSPVLLLLGNAATFVLSAILIRSIPRKEQNPPVRGEGSKLSTEVVAGIRYLVKEPLLRRLFISWMIFAGAVAAMTPVTQVFYLRELQFSEQEYGLLMGLPSLGGLVGSWVTGLVTTRWGLERTVYWSSVLRTPWYLAYPLAPSGAGGLSLLLISFTGILFFSSLTNSSVSALRMELTPDELISRTSSAWTISTMGAGPILIPALGFVMQLAGARVALWVIFGMVVVSILVLPAQELCSTRRST